MMKRNAFLIFVFMALIASAADAATVAARSASRSSAARAPTMAVKVNKSDTTTTATNSTTTPIVVQSVATPATTNNAYVAKTVDFGPIENKTTFFDTILDNASLTNTDAAASNLASLVRAQRAALDASSNATTTAVSTAKVNACDAGLRSCMTDKCGKNFAKCSSDNDTIFGTKLDACRRNLTCTANEFKLLSAEIKSDRAQAIKLKAFNDILDCGNEYDQCILNQCGTTYAKCLGRRDGDTAISKCSSIANRCAAMDNGLPNRAMSVFATLRQNAEKQIVSDENQLYTMRDNMRSICQRIGAMFDDRSLDCVYTVNFYAGEDSTLYASKKLYAGSTFDCTPNWFGVDVTTFMDNAYRLTRSQTSASSAMLGSGLGMAVGSLTSGAIDRAMDTRKLQNAKNAAEKEWCEQQPNMKWNGLLKKCVDNRAIKRCTDKGGIYDEEQKKCITAESEKKEALKKRNEQCHEENAKTEWSEEEQNCVEKSGNIFTKTADKVKGVFSGSDENATTVATPDTQPQSQGQPGETNVDRKKNRQKAKQEEQANKDRLKENCEKDGNGTWRLGKCKCKNGTPDTDGFCPEPINKVSHDAVAAATPTNTEPVVEESVEQVQDGDNGGITQKTEVVTVQSYQDTNNCKKPEQWQTLADANTCYILIRGEKAAKQTYINDVRDFIAQQHCPGIRSVNTCFDDYVLDCKNGTVLKAADYPTEYAIICNESVECETYTDQLQKTSYNCHYVFNTQSITNQEEVQQMQIEQEQSYQPIAEQEITSNAMSIYDVIGTGSSKQKAIDNWIANAKDFMPKKYCSGGVLGTLYCPGENGNDSAYMTCSFTGFDSNIDYNDLRNDARIICANKQLREKLLTTPKYDTKTKTYSVQLNPTTPRLSCTEKLEILNIENIPAYTELRNNLYRDIYEQYSNKTATLEHEYDACTSLIHGRLEMDCYAGQNYDGCIPEFEEFIYCLADKQALKQYKEQQEKNNCRGL